METEKMPDVQNEEPEFRGLKIQAVGIEGFHCPVTVLDRANKHQTSVAEVGAYVSLPEDQKGTHMSRIVEVISEFSDKLNLDQVPHILRRLKERLDAPEASFCFTMPYFMTRYAPVTGKSSLISYRAGMSGSIGMDDEIALELSVTVPVTTLCPCSKSISDMGAHNQRASIHITIEPVEDGGFIWLEELIEYAEKAASCEIYPLLKREDEKFVTEKAYNNPKFVEDVVREVSELLKSDKRIKAFTATVRSFESIHTHTAVAHISECGETRLEKAVKDAVNIIIKATVDKAGIYHAIRNRPWVFKVKDVVTEMGNIVGKDGNIIAYNVRQGYADIIINCINAQGDPNAG